MYTQETDYPHLQSNITTRKRSIFELDIKIGSEQNHLFSNYEHKRKHLIIILFHSIVAMEAISETSTYLHFSHHFKQDMTNEYAQIMEVRNTCSNYVF